MLALSGPSVFFLIALATLASISIWLMLKSRSARRGISAANTQEIPIEQEMGGTLKAKAIFKKREPLLAAADLPVGTRVRYPFLDAKGSGSAIVIGPHPRKPGLVTIRRTAAAPGDANFSRRSETLTLA